MDPYLVRGIAWGNGKDDKILPLGSPVRVFDILRLASLHCGLPLCTRQKSLLNFLVSPSVVLHTDTPGAFEDMSAVFIS